MHIGAALRGAVRAARARSGRESPARRLLLTAGTRSPASDELHRGWHRPERDTGRHDWLRQQPCRCHRTPAVRSSRPGRSQSPPGGDNCRPLGTGVVAPQRLIDEGTNIGVPNPNRQCFGASHRPACHRRAVARCSGQDPSRTGHLSATPLSGSSRHTGTTRR